MVEAVRDAGFVAATTTARGRAEAGSDPWRLPHIKVARYHYLPQIIGKVVSGYEDR